MKKFAIVALVLLGMFVQMQDSSLAATSLDDKKKKKKEDIKLVLQSAIKKGGAPLIVQVIAQIEAPKELDQYIYESSYEWLVQGSFKLTSVYTGGNSTPRNLRSTPETAAERMLYGQKQLVAKQRKRAPRKKYKEGMEVPRTLTFDITLDKAGKYFITLRLRREKYVSNVIVIDVSGDTSFDPLRDPY